VSYVRWSSPGHPWDYDSALYIFDDVAGGITCCGCLLIDADFNAPTTLEMISHVEQHVAAGHAVPDFVIPRLQEGDSPNTWPRGVPPEGWPDAP
jgi:hypothetical protein